MKRADVVYEQASALLVEALPELREAVEREIQDSAADPTILYSLCTEALNPHIDKLLDAHIEGEVALGRLFDFIERLSSSTDARVKDVVLTTILPHLVGEPRLAVGRRYMGRATLRLLKAVQRDSLGPRW
jgi:hypothetical protein